MRQHDKAERNHPESEHRQKPQGSGGDQGTAERAAHGDGLRHWHAPAEDPHMSTLFVRLVRFLGRLLAVFGAVRQISSRFVGRARFDPM